MDLLFSLPEYIIRFQFLDFLFPGCKGAAKLLFTGTLTLGCKSYLDAQKNACYCPPPKSKYKKYPGDGEL